MTQQEFMVRTGYTPKSEEEFWTIHDEYVNSPFSKDEFCKAWKHHHARELSNGFERTFATEAECEEFVIECEMRNCVFSVTGRKSVRVW